MTVPLAPSPHPLEPPDGPLDLERPALVARRHTMPPPRRAIQTRTPPPSALAAYLTISPPLLAIPVPLPNPLPVATLPPTPREGVTRSRRRGHVVGTLGGNSEDWASVDTVCRTIAEDQVFKLLMREPETAGVCVGSTLLTVRSHGELKVFQGFEQWVCTYEHGHKERDEAGNERHWEGTRRYLYTAIVETCSV